MQFFKKRKPQEGTLHMDRIGDGIKRLSDAKGIVA